MSEESKVDETPLYVEASSLTGLRMLKSAGFLDISNEECDDVLCSSWSSSDDMRVHFDAAGTVILLNLGGKRLHRGFPSAEALSHLSVLRSLNLGGTDLPLKDTENVLSIVASSIESVYLGGNGLGNEGAKMIARWLSTEKPENLVKIDLRYNDIGGEGMEILCDGLLHARVMYLHLEGNQIGNAGCASLSKLLKLEACHLVEVFLGGNKIEAAGAAQLASSLEANTTLTKLYLEGNSIGPEGATAFSEALEELKENKKHIKHLFVDNNNIGKEGSQRLARALDSRTAIPDGV